MGLRLKTAPATEPVSLVEAKLFLRVDHSDEDSLINDLIQAARECVEEYTKRALITQTWTMFLDQFPPGQSDEWWAGTMTGHIGSLNESIREIKLPRPPLVSVTHLKSYDDSDTATTFAATNYIVDTTRQPGRMILKNSQAWPSNLRAGNAVEVEFICGYGAASAVPRSLKTALYLILAKMYDCRSAATDIPESAKKMMNPYVVTFIGDPNPGSMR